jgi:hypothetical protein
MALAAVSMAITPTEFGFLHAARQRGCLPPGGRILEFGESETLQLNAVAALELLQPDGRFEPLLARARALQGSPGSASRYEEARLIYQALFEPASYTAIDLQPGASHRIQQDLNQPFDLGTRYDVCINNGTSEHVFNQGNFYKAMHDHTRPGGIMIHWTPGFGWINHGLFNVQPGFFHDLARDNGYEMCFGCLATPGNLYVLDPALINDAALQAHPELRNSLACAVLRKGADAPFRFPLQGSYSALREHVTAP